MESLLKRCLVLCMLLLPFTSFAYKSEKFEMKAPEGRVESPKMFGSDVMFLKEGKEGEGAIFVKFLKNPKPVDDYDKFLLEKIKSSKSIDPTDLAPVSEKKINQHHFYYTSYKDSKTKDSVFTGMYWKNKNDYVFLFMKDSPSEFLEGRKRLLKAVETLNF